MNIEGSMTLSERFPVGTFFTLPPEYKNERGAILRITGPVEEEPNSFRSFGVGHTGIHHHLGPTAITSVHAIWPDGGQRYFPHYRVDVSKIMVIQDPRYLEDLVMDVLGGKWETQRPAYFLNKEARRCMNKISNLVRNFKDKFGSFR